MVLLSWTSGYLENILARGEAGFNSFSFGDLKLQKPLRNVRLSVNILHCCEDVCGMTVVCLHYGGSLTTIHNLNAKHDCSQIKNNPFNDFT